MTQKKDSITYKDAGVDIDAGDEFVDNIKGYIKRTERPGVLSSLGGYAGLFKLDLKKYPEPVMVSSTDGVGTKLKLAFDMKKYDTIGIDLVAMCVNDLICCGAEPLFFLDYFATGKLEKGVPEQVVKGMTEGLQSINCSLLGGETAEMPGLYQKGEFDLAGFSVGVVNKDRIIEGQKIQEGDTLIGLASSGVHSNGYSLVREILKRNNVDIQKDSFTFGRPIGEELLIPTKLYVNPVLQLIESNDIRGIAHITGGGIVENLPRVFPAGLAAQVEKSKIQIPAIFSLLQELGNVPEDEMWRVFNMGIGLVLVVPPSEEKAVLEKLQGWNYPAAVIGRMIRETNEAKGVVLV